MFTYLLDLLFPLRTDEEIVRGLTLEQFLSLLEPQIEEGTTPATVGLFPFGDRRVRAMIHEAKYHGNEKAFDFLAAALAEYLREALADTFIPQTVVLIPIPLGKKRFQERGFNQVEEVVRRAAKELGIATESNLLARQRETVSQVSLAKAARRKNMQNAFAATQPASPELLYILVDDVTTTGATLASALFALEAGGAKHLLPIALAH
jgi:competence protein ComFC